MRIGLVFPALLLAGCSLPCCRRESSDLTTAPAQASIDGRSFRLNVSLWRDFMPVAGPAARHPLQLSVQVIADDNLPLPDDVAIDRIWVLQGKTRWQPRPQAQWTLQAGAADGPEWEVGSSADVVVRLRRDRETSLLRAPGVRVIRTD
jgi:hypothetical protein